MIKKINFLLILIASLGSIYFAVTKDNNIVFILKDISVIITISALYIIQKIFKIHIDEFINLIYILFIFMAHFLGVVCDLYSQIYWFDKLAHFLSGVLSAFGAILILVKFKTNKNILFSIIFIISFTLFIASLWEMFEYLSSCLFDVDPQLVVKTGVHDTMGDIIVAFLGSILISISYYFEHKLNINFLTKKFIKVI